MYLIGKLDSIRKKHQRDDILLTGMGMEAGEVTEEQREEDLATYESLVQPLKRRCFDKILEEEEDKR